MCFLQLLPWLLSQLLAAVAVVPLPLLRRQLLAPQLQTQLASLLSAAGTNPDGSITSAYNAALAAYNAAVAAQAAAAQAASDLAVASKVNVVGVVNGGRTICAAATTCTKAELLALSLKAAQTAVASADAANTAIYLALVLRDQILFVNPSASVTSANALITTAQTAAAAAQTAANTSITNYQALATALGTTGTTITGSTGTTGTTGTSGTSGTSGTTGTI
jgi:hypothetical protein